MTTSPPVVTAVRERAITVAVFVIGPSSPELTKRRGESLVELTTAAYRRVLSYSLVINLH